MTDSREPLKVWQEGYEPGGRHYIEPPPEPVREPAKPLPDSAALAQEIYDKMVEENRKLAEEHGDGNYQERESQ